MQRRGDGIRHGIHGMAMRAWLSVLPVIVLVVVGWLLSSLVMGGLELPDAVPLGVRAALLSVVAFAAMRHLLSGGVVEGFHTLRQPTPRALETFAMLAVLMAMLLRLLGYLLDGLVDEADTFGDIAVTLGPVILALALVGTIFPAIVDGGDTSFRAALARRSFWPTVWRMSNAVGICFVMMMAIVAVGTFGGGGASLWLMSLGFGAVLCYGTVALSVIVTGAYLGARQQENTR